MALSLMVACGCGRRYQVYVPKAVLFGELMGEAGNWAEVDAEEMEAGELELIQGLGHEVGTVFVDSRATPLVLRECGRVFDPIGEVRARLRQRERS